MATIGPFIAGMGETVTLRARNYGARDGETGWPAITFTESSIKAFIRELGTTVRDAPSGRVVEQRARMFTTSVVSMRDQFTYVGYYWEVEDVEFSHMLLGDLGYYNCTLVRLNSV